MNNVNKLKNHVNRIIEVKKNLINMNNVNKLKKNLINMKELKL